MSRVPHIASYTTLMILHCVIRRYVQGETKLTNSVRDLLSCYRTASLPRHWSALYAINDSGLSMTHWLDDLILRMVQLLSYAPVLNSRGNIILAVNAATSYTFSLGRMFVPEAFIMACRQETAQVTIIILCNKDAE